MGRRGREELKIIWIVRWMKVKIIEIINNGERNFKGKRNLDMDVLSLEFLSDYGCLIDNWIIWFWSFGERFGSINFIVYMLYDVNWSY